MKQLISGKVELPVIYLVCNEEELDKLPLGIPFIYGDEEHYDLIVKYLEYIILLRSAEATGIPLKWEEELSRLGYTAVNFKNDISLYFSGDSEDRLKDKAGVRSVPPIGDFKHTTESYLKDGFLVSYDILTNLNIVPSWLRDLEESVRVNVLNAVTFNPMSFSKKLGGFYGAPEMVASKRNLGVLDFSGSIPDSVVTTTAALAKTLARTFFCDIMITGSITKLFTYEELEGVDLMKEAREIGRNNDQAYYKDLVSIPRDYNAVFSFGDDDSPGYSWSSGDKAITDEEGKKICKWTCEKVISLHTKQDGRETGYTRWFSPTEGVKHVKDWLHTLKR